MPIHRSRSWIGSEALYSSLVSSVLKKLLTDGCPARSTWSSSPSRRRLQRPQIRMSGAAPSALVGISMHHRAHVGLRCWNPRPSKVIRGRLVRRGEVPRARRVEQTLDAVEVEEERVAAGTCEEREAAGGDDVRRLAERHLDSLEDLRPDGFGLLGLVVAGQVHVDGLTPVRGLGEHEAERDVVAQVAVVVDGEAVDRVRVQEVRLRVGVEDQHRPAGIGRRLEGVQVAEVEALIAERRTEAEPGEVV